MTAASGTAPSLVAYISGHGYGHYTRSAAVLEALRRRRPDVILHARTDGQALGLARESELFDQVSCVDVGPGVAQRGPLAVNVPSTRAALGEHLRKWDALVAGEAEFLARGGASLVYADVPPLAFAAAKRAVVPSVGMGNFSWSWIYAGYAPRDAWFAAASERLAAAEAQADEFLSLAMGGGLEVFPRRRAIPPVARAPERDAESVRRALGISSLETRPLVMVSFGGFGGALDLRVAASKNPALRLLVVSAPEPIALENACSIEPSRALPHHDLVAAADCVIGKPGYGTVAECLHRPTAFVHVPRGDFREYPFLVAAIERHLPSATLSIDDLYAGRWTDAVTRALATSPPEPALRADGVEQAADALAALLPAAR